MIHPLSPKNIRRAAAPAALVAVAFLVASCGGGGESAAPKADKAPAAAAAAGPMLEVTGTEYAFAPAPAKASAGQTTIRFVNKGLVEHDITIDALKVKIVAQAGKTAEASAALKAGTYETYCSIPGHKESGMKGKLTVS